jgi:hypothetical protein
MNISIEEAAQIAYEVNKAYCQALGDNSFTTDWFNAPQWQRDTNIAGVKFHLANPEATPSASHDSWLAVKKAEGWKYGKVKDADKKVHPCFVPYEKLPPAQKAKDYIFKALVTTLDPYTEVD